MIQYTNFDMTSRFCVVPPQDTQNGQILRALERGERLTLLDALQKFGCFRLAARVKELRDMGWPVEMRTVTLNGKRIAEYRL